MTHAPITRLAVDAEGRRDYHEALAPATALLYSLHRTADGGLWLRIIDNLGRDVAAYPAGAWRAVIVDARGEPAEAEETEEAEEAPRFAPGDYVRLREGFPTNAEAGALARVVGHDSPPYVRVEWCAGKANSQMDGDYYPEWFEPFESYQPGDLVVAEPHGMAAVVLESYETGFVRVRYLGVSASLSTLPEYLRPIGRDEYIDWRQARLEERGLE